MTVFGYARISTKQQSIERQIRNILTYDPKARIYQEAYTGTKCNRPEWNKLLKRVKSGDTIIFDSVSRMSRNAEDGVRQYFELFDKNINLLFLEEPYINTDTYRESINKTIDFTGNEIADCYIEATNKVLKILAEKQIQIAFEQSQKETDDNSQRTIGGIRSKKIKNEELINKYGSVEEAMKDPEWTQIGQKSGAKLVTKKSIMAKGLITLHCKEFGGSLNDKQMMELLHLSRNTYYKYKREIRELEDQ